MRYTENMLYIRSLTATEQRTLRQLQGRATATLAQRARMVFLSADGWSVPALAELIGCCRRTVRKWLHAFVEHGLAGLLGKAVGRPAQVVSSPPLSATPLPSPAPSRLVSVIALTVPEIRRLLNRVVWPQQPAPAHALHWSVYRRYKQALAKQSHYRKRGATPPPLQQLRLEY
jgi:Homeodomain-like domain